jgi:Mg-chelatase subunit ChlD
MKTLKHTRSVIFATLLLCGAAAAQDASDASAGATFRSSVSEVRVTFFATNQDNRPVENPTAADFAVFDNGMVVRNFRSFTRSDETSLDVVAMVDMSASVAPRFRNAMADVLQLVSREQSVPDDNIAVLSFGGLHPAILCSSGCRDANAAGKFLAAKSGGLTPLYDGLVFGADFVAHHRRAGVRPVLILFSDGRDTISMHSAREAAEEVVASGAMVYAVDISTSQDGPQGSAFLRWISDATGGRYFSARDGAATVLNAVLDDLRASYVVTYQLPNRQAGFHSLRIMPTRNLNLSFHHRNGYYYENTAH